MSTAKAETSGPNKNTEPAPLHTSPSNVDVYSLEAPAGVEQPYLSRMVPLSTTTEQADGVATRCAGAYGVGWSTVQGPPSLFAAGSPWVGWRQ